ncbi:hypothetical protein BG58_03750 [Caballeronia jiangsuensis]|nr:hypothetical protein BG58_03750 [Caballeronia jiangsuensis]
MPYTYDDKLNFIKNLYCPARRVGEETGCSWELILAQAAQETGWGEKILPGSNNIFNIKADASWKGESKVFRVWEINAKGEKVWVDDAFRIYRNNLDSLRDRQKFLSENPRYAKAGLLNAGVKGDFVREAKALQAAGYATDPNYAASLKEVFDGKTMKRALKAAQEQGCEGCLPTINVRVLDAARVPVSNAKLIVKQGTRKIDLVTNADGRVQIQATQSGGPVSVQVWSEHDKKWVSAGDAVTPGASSTVVTLIAPSITVEAHTEAHKAPEEKKESDSASSSATKPPSKSDKPREGNKGERQSSNAHYITYTIKKGDSLGDIAKAHSTDYRTLAGLNGIKSPYIIHPKQVIKVPRRGLDPEPSSKADEEPLWTSTWEALRSLLHSSRSSLDTVHYRGKEDHPQTDLHLGGRAPWMEIAEKEFTAGIRRGGGTASDQHIVQYFRATTLHESDHQLAKEAYCAAFVNWCLTQAGFKGNRSAGAASLAKWGRSTRGNKPAYGAVAVVRFPEGGHHVTFVSGKAVGGSSRIATLGGNQGRSHEVSHSALPASWVVAYRFPLEYVETDQDYALDAVRTDGSTMSAVSTH